MSIINRHCLLNWVAFTGCLGVFSAMLVDATELTIRMAQEVAVNNDKGVAQLMARSRAAISEGESMSQLPDPTLILGAQNFPTDTFRLDQEPMTQLKVGVRQMFPQGDTLALQGSRMGKEALALQSDAMNRHLSVTREVRYIWLEVQYWIRAREILREDEAIFGQLLEVTHSLYSVGSVQQQDVLRAELELSRLQEKIIQASSLVQTEQAKLARWVGSLANHSTWPALLPNLALPVALDNLGDAEQERQWIARRLQSHPQVLSLKHRVEVADMEIDLSEQQYQPAWGVEVSYGYRDGNNMDGSDRADFLSAMVTVSMPIFSSIRQDSSVQGALSRKNATEGLYEDKLNELAGQAQTTLRRLHQAERQLSLFDERILDQSRLQAEASLSAYQADAAPFSEVMRAYLREQTDRLDYERLLTTRLQLLSELQYFFAPGNSEYTAISDRYSVGANMK